MHSVTAFEREKLELDAVLASGIFHRAPNLALLLTYVCRKYFEGAADEIKEYNIAVEALSRPPEFDQKRDSIVRVEAHRLRKRLKEYYAGPGAGHEIHIEIPPGQYAPRFVSIAREVSPPLPGIPNELSIVEEPGPPDTGRALVPVPEVIDVPLLPSAPPGSQPIAEVPQPALFHPEPRSELPRATRRRWPSAAGIVCLLAVAGILYVRDKEPATRPVRAPEQKRPGDTGEDIRILAGVENGSYVDAFDRTWLSDRFFSGGYVAGTPRSHPILGTRDQGLYRSRREGGFRYDIPLPPGPRELKLYFAETVFGDNNVAGGGETTRMFNVTVTGRTILDSFDVINDAGSAMADVKVFKDISPAADGKLHLEFSPLTNPAFVNAIELVPSTPGRIRPTRIVARDRGVSDGRNRYWDPDRYALGGQLIARPESQVRDADPELFRSERFGNITYTIPVAAEGRYGINLYFTENWFGPGMPGGGGVGGRIFDSLINGVAFRRNFDIFKESGGNGHAAIVSLHGVQANHQGKIVISLNPARNYACINALEILDETN